VARSGAYSPPSHGDTEKAAQSHLTEQLEAVGASAVGTRLSQSTQQLLPLLHLVRPAGEDLVKG
jgi:hypothetical protein